MVVPLFYIHVSRHQGCARLKFSGWLDPDSCDNPGDLSDTNQHFIFLDWLNSDWTQISKLLTWFDSDSIHLSQSWVKFYSRLITFYLIWPKAVDRWGGGGVRSNAAVSWFSPCNATNKCKILTFSVQKNHWPSFDSSSIQLTQLWL